MRSPVLLLLTRRADVGRDLALALLPTLTVLLVLAGMELFLKQHLLFASLASSAFGIYLAPHHKANRVRVLLFAQLGAALIGFFGQKLLGPGYVSAALAMMLTIALMVALDVLHPPAISTALSFAFVPVAARNVGLFLVALALLVVLVVGQKKVDALWQRFEEARR